MSRPLVSCIIPCYNRPDYVCDAIASALAQTYSPIEIIVVDDGSTDGETPRVLAEYTDRITVIRQDNGGTAAARNTGVAASSGEYLAWLDSDDAWLPQKIASQVDAAIAMPHAGVIYTACSDIDESGDPPSPTDPIAIPETKLRSHMMPMFVVESEVMPSSCLMPRAVLDDSGWFDPEYSAEDWELNFRIARKYPYAYIDAPLTRYRVHNESKSKDRWPHAVGLLKLRHSIEAAREELLAADPSPEMRLAYKRHDRKYADAYYRVGKAAMDRGNITVARENFAQAIRRDPFVLKYYTRGVGALLRR